MLQTNIFSSLLYCHINKCYFVNYMLYIQYPLMIIINLLDNNYQLSLLFHNYAICVRFDLFIPGSTLEVTIANN